MLKDWPSVPIWLVRTVDSVLSSDLDRRTEVEQEPDVNAGGFEVVDQLYFVNGTDLLNSLQFQNDTTLYP